jgi:hypothetical protein
VFFKVILISDRKDKNGLTLEPEVTKSIFVYCCTNNFSAIWWLSPLPVTGLQI